VAVLGARVEGLRAAGCGLRAAGCGLRAAGWDLFMARWRCLGVAVLREVSVTIGYGFSHG